MRYIFQMLVLYQFRLVSQKIMILNKYKLIFALFAFLFCGAAKAFACDCALLTTEQAVEQSKAVFSGEVVGFEYRKGIPNQFINEQEKLTGKKIEYETLVVKVRVNQKWKGEPPAEIYLLQSKTRYADGTMTIPSCDYTFDLGATYLIYATKYNVKEKNEYRTGVCLPTKKLSAAEEDLKILGDGEKVPENEVNRKSSSSKRSFDCFQRINERTKISDINRLCGKPERDVGSGIHIYEYDLRDGSTARVGSPDGKQILYVFHIFANGQKSYFYVRK